MKPVVLVYRTPPADAFIYARYEDRQRTHAAELMPVKVGQQLAALSPDDVELLR